MPLPTGKLYSLTQSPAELGAEVVGEDIADVGSPGLLKGGGDGSPVVEILD